MTRKLIYALIVIIIIGGAVAGYFWWYLPQQEVTLVSQERTLAKISDGVVISPINSYDNDAIWYGLESGRLMWHNLNTGVQTEYPLPQILGKSFNKIHWPRQGNDFIARSTLEGQPQFSYFNYAEKRYYALPANVVTLDWMSNSAKIAIIWKSGDGKTYLVTSNPDASGYKVLRELPWPDMTIKASSSSDTALLMRTSIGEVNKIYLFNLETGEYTEEVSAGRNTSVAWSPKGDRFAFTRLVDGKSMVYVHDLLNDKDTEVGTSAGVEKMTFSMDGDQLYAVLLADDGRTEEIWEINLVTEERVKVFSSDSLRMKNLIIIGKKIFFLDQSNALYGYQ
jgi:hypothetical protein